MTHRPIRSYVRREGRLTRGQQRAFDTLWPEWGVPFQKQTLDPAELFGRRAPLTLEIGFGNGDNLATQAGAHPEQDFLGVEVHRPGVGHLLLKIEELGLTNVRIACHDAVEVLRHQLPDGAVDRAQILFPDPWPKKRHHKRRLVQSGFLELLARKLRPGGLLHLATDWQEYAEHMLATLDACPLLENTVASGGFSPRPAERPLTRFEGRGQRLGHEIRDLIYRRRPQS